MNEYTTNWLVYTQISGNSTIEHMSPVLFIICILFVAFLAILFCIFNKINKDVFNNKISLESDMWSLKIITVVVYIILIAVATYGSVATTGKLVYESVNDVASHPYVSFYEKHKEHLTIDKNAPIYHVISDFRLDDDEIKSIIPYDVPLTIIRKGTICRTVNTKIHSKNDWIDSEDLKKYADDVIQHDTYCSLI